MVMMVVRACSNCGSWVCCCASTVRAARELRVTQPALSKTLAQLRRYFDGSPVRARGAADGAHAESLAIADAGSGHSRRCARAAPSTALRSAKVAPDIQFLRGRRRPAQALPPLVERLITDAPNVRLHVHELDAAHLERWPESGKLDFAMGSFPSMQKASVGSRYGSNVMSASFQARPSAHDR